MVKFNFNFCNCIESFKYFKNEFEILKKLSMTDKYEFKKQKTVEVKLLFF